MAQMLHTTLRVPATLTVQTRLDLVPSHMAVSHGISLPSGNTAIALDCQERLSRP